MTFSSSPQDTENVSSSVTLHSLQWELLEEANMAASLPSGLSNYPSRERPAHTPSSYSPTSSLFLHLTGLFCCSPLSTLKGSLVLLSFPSYSTNSQILRTYLPMSPLQQLTFPKKFCKSLTVLPLFLQLLDSTFLISSSWGANVQPQEITLWFIWHPSDKQSFTGLYRISPSRIRTLSKVLVWLPKIFQGAESNFILKMFLIF